jgi:hypothetical protein
MIHVQCPSCGAEGEMQEGMTLPDEAVRCVSPEGSPPGSVEGSCSTMGHTHEEHIAHVLETMDATARPVIITASAVLSGEVSQ